MAIESQKRASLDQLNEKDRERRRIKLKNIERTAEKNEHELTKLVD